MKDFAKNFHAEHRGNCAMAVAAAWIDAHGLDPNEIEAFKSCGAGRAEGGMCGALYAAIHYLPQKKAEIVREFEKGAGGTLCKEIRPKKDMTCTERVALAAEILDRLQTDFRHPG